MSIKINLSISQKVYVSTTLSCSFDHILFEFSIWLYTIQCKSFIIGGNFACQIKLSIVACTTITRSDKSLVFKKIGLPMGLYSYHVSLMAISRKPVCSNVKPMC